MPPQTSTEPAPRLPVIDLLEAEIPHLRRWARHLTRNSDNSDDLVQDCLLRAIANAASLRPGTDLRAWLFTILRNLFISDLRTAKRRGLTVSTDTLGDLSTPANQESHIELNEVRNAFRQLGAEHRDVLLLVAIEGFSYEDAARVLSVPVGTIRSRLSRARQALRSQVERGESRPSVSASVGR
jgi:RNA polymerase sigma-70 factor (ECF subfamily)